MSKNVAVFVDVANIFYAAKAAGVDIDYVTLLKSASAGRDLVRAYAYTGLDPENENQRNFHSFLARHGYKVVSKDIRKYGDGKVKANLDIELVIDMMKTARNLDIAIVVSGDGDFAPAIRAVQEMGVRVEVISFRGNTSSDLIDVADQFTDIIQLARVEKASSRSGRRVAGDDEDLSMTEVPDKQTEGTGTGRGRGRGRRATGRDAEPAASRGGRSAEPAVALTSSGAPLVVLPGEKLSKVSPAVASAAEDEDEEAAAEGESAFAAASGVDRSADGDANGRRRRRRGGRGRGRGRQRGEGVEQRPPRIDEEVSASPDEPEEFVDAPRPPRSTPFGSVWDSQLGVPTAAQSSTPSVRADEDEDFDEPEIPEYLIAERRNRGRGPGIGAGGNRGRGNRSAYAAAMDRERYGGGRSGGINRYPDVGDRGRPPQGPGGFQRRDRPDRPDRDRQDRGDRNRFVPQPRGGDEPWSEVPPELEAMLRAQVSSRPRPESPDRGASDGRSARPRTGVSVDAVAVPIEVGPPASPEPASTESADAAPKRRTATRRTTKASAGAADDKPKANAAEADAPKRRTTRKTTSSKAAASNADAEKPKRRTTRRKAGDEAPSPADAE